ncbi:MAG: hypothetical protein NW205_01715 [Hyphomicrobiaceae bacterium]|nr:hypothetical protein [Hyphomicrobiaceae bacterium]
MLRQPACAALSALAVFWAPPAAGAAERAEFLKGTYATADGCRKLQKLAAGTPRSVETVPETLDAEGFHGWEGGCRFTRIFEHEAGKVWIGLMFCVEGASLTPQTYAFVKGDGDSFEVAGSEDDEPDLYLPCNDTSK